VFDFNVVPLSKQIWPKTWLLNFWTATGVPSLLNESFGTEPGNWTRWEKIAGSLKWNELPQQHRASSNTSLSSMAWSWLNFFERNKNQKKRKNWASYVTLSWRTNVKAQKRIHNMYWPGWWRHTELAQGHVSWLNFFRVFFVRFFSFKKLSQLRGAEPATGHWASYEALSQQRGIEPATWHWASNQIID